MKNTILIALLILIISCKQNEKKETYSHLKNGFYEVTATGPDKTKLSGAIPNTIVVPYNSIYDQQDFA